MDDDLDLQNLSAQLLEHIADPCNAGVLSDENGCALFEDPERGASVRITLRVEDERVTAAAFQANGDSVLIGCTNFLVDWVTGEELDVARGMRPRVLTYCLDLPNGRHWCSVMAVKCLLLALRDFKRRQPSMPDEWQGSRHRNRHRADADKGDTDAQERFYIVGILTNLLLCLETGHSAHHVHEDCTAKERETLLCDLASIRPIIPTLPKEIRQVISLIGLQGLTERQAGERLGVSQPMVNKRLQTGAQLIQAAWKAGRRKSATPGM